jgi:hypothetical protein
MVENHLIDQATKVTRDPKLDKNAPIEKLDSRPKRTIAAPTIDTGGDLEFPVVTKREGKEYLVVLHMLAKDKLEAEFFMLELTDALDHYGFLMDDEVGIVNGTMCNGHLIGLKNPICQDLQIFEAELNKDVRDGV